MTKKCGCTFFIRIGYKTTISRNTNEQSMTASDSLHFFYYPNSNLQSDTEHAQNSSSVRTEDNHEKL